MTVEITDKNFESQITNQSKPVVLDFWAPGCGPCQIIGNHIEKLAEDYRDQVLIGKINAASNSALAIKFGVRTVPTVLYLKNGAVVNKVIGSTSKLDLEEKLKIDLLRID